MTLFFDSRSSKGHMYFWGLDWSSLEPLQGLYRLSTAPAASSLETGTDVRTASLNDQLLVDFLKAIKSWNCGSENRSAVRDIADKPGQYPTRHCTLLSMYCVAFFMTSLTRTLWRQIGYINKSLCPNHSGILLHSQSKSQISEWKVQLHLHPCQ